jgi:hypothetical protein
MDNLLNFDGFPLFRPCRPLKALRIFETLESRRFGAKKMNAMVLKETTNVHDR